MNKENVTVLVTSAGGAAGQNCIDALRNQDELTCKIIAADANPLSAGLFKSDKSFIVPSINNENYISTLLSICARESVDVIIPTYSKEIKVFSSNIHLFEERSVKMCMMHMDGVLIFESKWLTYKFFQENSIPTIPTWKIDDLPFSPKYPIYLKPDKGSGTRNHYKIDSSDELVIQLKKITDDYVVQNFVAGQEITIDIIADKRSQILAAIARERVRVQNGMAVVSKTIPVTPYFDSVQKIVSKSELIGPANIQGFFVNDEFFVTDINTRFAAGGLPLTVAAGANIPLMTVKLALGKDVFPIHDYKTGLVMIRYYCEFFVQDEGEGFVLQNK